MEKTEQRAAELIASSVVVANAPGYMGGGYTGGMGTVVGEKTILTTSHVGNIQQTMYAWKPGENRGYKVRVVKTSGENVLMQTVDGSRLPCPALPIADKKLSTFLQPGATLLWPGGYEFYSLNQHNKLPIVVGYYNGPWEAHPHMHLAQGRCYLGTSGGGIYTVEEGLIVGAILEITAVAERPGSAKTSDMPSSLTTPPAITVFYDTEGYLSNFVHSSSTSGIPPAESDSDVAEKILPGAKSFWAEYKPVILAAGAGLIGSIIAKELS